MDSSFGGADDISRSQNNGDRLDNPEDIEAILDHGQERTQSLIGVTKDGLFFVHAQAHTGIGESGHSGRDINTKGHRDVKVALPVRGDVVDGITVFRGLIRRSRGEGHSYNGFSYIEDGLDKTARELLYSLLPRFAAAFLRDVEPGTTEMSKRAFPVKGFIGSMALAMATEMKFGLGDGVIGEHITESGLIVLTPTIMQIDGEPYPVRPGTKFDLEVLQDAITTLWLPKETKKELIRL